MSTVEKIIGRGRGRGRGILRNPTLTLETVSRRRLPPPPEMEVSGQLDSSQTRSPSPPMMIKVKEVQKLTQRLPPPLPGPVSTECDKDTSTAPQPPLGMEGEIEYKLTGDDLFDSVAFLKSVQLDSLRVYNTPHHDLEFSIPSLPNKSGEVGTEFMQYEFLDDKLGGEEELPVVKIIEPIKLPKKFVIKDGRYFLENEGDGRVILSTRVAVYCHLLHMDQRDVWYVRRMTDDGDPFKKKVPTPSKKSYETILSDIDTFYGTDSWVDDISEDGADLVDLQSLTWHPLVDEVVIVKIARKYIDRNHGYARKIEYQRARVLELSDYGAHVELIDDYGAGGIGYKHILKMRPEFAVIPPQLFTCELAGMEFLSFRKIVHQVLKEFPLPYHRPMFRLEFNGDYSERGCPLVNASFWKDCVDVRQDVKDHVLKNAADVLSPYRYLLDNSSRCRAMRADADANVWLLFNKDADLHRSICHTLEKVRPTFDYYRQCCGLTVANIMSHEKENWERVYAAVLPDKTLNKERLCRVKLLDVVDVRKKKDSEPVNGKLNMVHVDNMDVGTAHFISSGELMPLSILAPELCHVPPLALCVHLNNMKELECDDPMTHEILFQRELRAALVFEWPDNVFPPEVAIYSTDKGDQKTIPNDVDNLRVTGLGLLLIKQKLSKSYTEEERNVTFARLDELLNWRAKRKSPRSEVKNLQSYEQLFAGDLFLFDA
ncbi:unnamed protein product [Orchesella dallaii]|uniref:Uncharacterized protein n=1 Tax=Orchesella dallaii TaxID=48710 RepID=A0ABP1PNN5_9HEXA